MKPKAMQFGLALLSLLFVYHFSYADGVYIPEARKKIPDIPVQRAIIKYHEGKETLIVESTLDGEGGHYGWIIPVPSPPTKFDKVSPGLLKTLSLQIQPKIHHVQPHENVFGVRIISIITILIVTTCFCIMRWGAIGIFPLILLPFSFFILPNFVEYRAGAGPSSIANTSVKITGSEIVGNYEVFVLEVQESSALDTWLQKNGFNKFQPEATKMIDEYISHDWLFVVSKLRTIFDGKATPHPILLEFETDKPVYPMKLTAIPSSTVYLELYFVGEKEALPVNYSIKKEYCNIFDFGQVPNVGYEPVADDPMGFIPRRIFRFEIVIHKGIAHSDALKVMWDGCVVTKFAGKVTSKEMKEDMFFQFKDAVPFQSELYSSIGAYNKAYYVVLPILTLGSILLLIYHGIKKSQKIKVSIIKLFLILLFSAATGFGLSYAMVGEKAEVYTIERYWLNNFRNRLYELFAVPDNTFSTGAELVDFLQRNGIDNPITGEPIIIEHSPGNIIVEKTGDYIEMKICLENGSPYTF